MNVKAFFHQLELNFWDSFIPLMVKSRSVRYVVPRVYRMFYTKEIQDDIKLIMIISLFGLILGFFLGTLPDL